MATLNQLHVPDELLSAIRRRASAQGISVEEQVLRDLATAEGVAIIAGADMLDEIRNERHQMASKGVHLTEEMLRDGKNWGRK